jgi:plastocyanin
MRLLLILPIVLLAGCGGGGSSSSPSSSKPSASATVDIKDFKYKPVTVEVARGGRIRWTNSDSAAHTATADDRSFDTQTIKRGASGMVSFTRAGTFAYHCDFHPFMKATVVVK